MILKTRLKQYQIQGDKQIEAFKGRCLIAWDMGLGKTITSAYYALKRDLLPMIVVCPASVKLQWQQQLWEHFRQKSTVLFGTKPKSLIGRKIIIINYDILHRWVPEIIELNPKIVIIDECQNIVNMGAKRSRAVFSICKGVKNILPMSGTPANNNPIELFPVLHLLNPEKFPSPFDFAFKYCESMEFSFGRWVYKGAKNLKHLNRTLVSNVMIRLRKDQVLTQLPPIQRVIVPMEIERREEYEEAETDLIAYLAKTDLSKANSAQYMEGRAQYVHLKHLVARLKLKYVKEWLDDFLRSSDGKILVGTWHRDIIGDLAGVYDGTCSVIDGGKTAQQRKEAEDSFRSTKKKRILFGQIQAAGVGLNLPEASTAALAELPWTATACEQFINRCHRLTSTGPVFAYFLIARNTIEQDVARIIERKSRHLSTALDGCTDSKRNLNLLQEYHEALKRRKKCTNSL